MHIAAHAPRQRQAVALRQGQEQIAALGHRRYTPAVEERGKLVGIPGEYELPSAETIELTPEICLQLVTLVYP